MAGGAEVVRFPSTLKQALSGAIEELTATRVGSPRMNAETLLMFTLGCDRAYLYAHPERKLTAAELARYQDAIRQRASGKPAQYITGHQEFWGLDLVVSPAVLIPRPETEHVVETTLELARAWPRPRIVDVGTGSGCIALALARELPQAEICGVDISAEALEIARANAARLQLDERVSFRQSDLLTGVPHGEGFDLVVSNPPYVSEAEPEKTQREVREFEPKVAVFAGADGLSAYRRLVPQAREVLRDGGWLVVEIGFSMEAPVRALLAGWSETRVTQDLQGIPRVVAARK
ncbi:MAG TPA: peptide chain release factor N(5)-glutamine methyltransferase [Terriglobales bacterium]|nr:peptide chain release factor N(5)-glutamine methyltransferase [Terriglobales bacterium]